MSGCYILKLQKKTVLAVLIALFVLMISSQVLAGITIEPVSKKEYNFGDRLELKGSVLTDADFSGEIRTIVLCNGSSFLFPSVWVDLDGGKPKTFPSDFKIPTIIFSSDLGGTCRAMLSLVRDGEPIANASSDEFMVSPELKGSFSISKQLIQSGQEFTLEGSVTRLDGSEADGYASIYFVHDEKEYLAGAVEIKDGAVSYTYKAEKTAPGVYSITVIAKDIYGNNQKFENVAQFELTNKLDMKISINEKELLPGSTITVSGIVKDAEGAALDGLPVILELGEITEEVELSDGEFEAEIVVPENIKSGQHTLQITVKDENGNIGEREESINVNPVPTRVGINVSSKQLMPGDTLVIRPIVYDQAGDIMGGKVHVEITGPDDKIVLSQDMESNSEFRIELQKIAPSGRWVINAARELEDSETVDAEAEFEVKEYVHATAKIEKQVISIINDGNVKYKDDIEIIVEGSEDTYKIKRRKNLDVAEIEVVDLAEEVPSGRYKVTVKLASGNQVFENVLVANGTETRVSQKTTYIILSTLVIMLLLLLAIKPKKKPKTKRSVKRIRSSAKPVHKKFSIKDLNHEQSVKEFRERVLREIKKTEEKSTQRKRFRPGLGSSEAHKPGGFESSGISSPASQSGRKNFLLKDSNAGSENAAPEKAGSQPGDEPRNMFSLFD